MQYRASNTQIVPPVIKNLIIINCLMLFGTVALQSRGIYFQHIFGMHWFGSRFFEIWQPITHMFMHGNFMHLLFNMYGIWFFGRMLEIVWGGKRFLMFYLLTGLAGMALYYLTVYLEIRTFDPELILDVYERGSDGYVKGYSELGSDKFWELNRLFNGISVGASGALFGILGANYILFGNTRIMLIFLPIPFKIKHFVIVYGLYELYRGIAAAEGDNIAHFAHIGGLIAGIILVKYWNKRNRNSFY